MTILDAVDVRNQSYNIEAAMTIINAVAIRNQPYKCLTRFKLSNSLKRRFSDNYFLKRNYVERLRFTHVHALAF